jgi:hypothetical protein
LRRRPAFGATFPTKTPHFRAYALGDGGALGNSALDHCCIACGFPSLGEHSQCPAKFDGSSPGPRDRGASQQRANRGRSVAAVQQEQSPGS